MVADSVMRMQQRMAEMNILDQLGVTQEIHQQFMSEAARINYRMREMHKNYPLQMSALGF